MTVAAAFIVKNGAATIKRAIASVRPHVDEVVVVDTGSTDGTLDVIEELAVEAGAPIVVGRFAWRDDFAAARNFAAELASCAFVIALDDDDVLECEPGYLRAALDGRGCVAATSPGPPELLFCHCVYTVAPGVVRGTVRLLAARAGMRWTGRIHEHLEIPPGLTRAVGDPARLRVLHVPVTVAGRHDHRAAVEREIRADPADRSMRFYLGRHLLADGDAEAAAAEFARAADGAPETLELVNVLEHRAICLTMLGDEEAAAGTLERAEGVLSRFLKLHPFYASFARVGRHPVRPDDSVWAYIAASAA